ncbi:MAG TPA: ABC transporter substrate-binding protein [Vicinamibacteria bacterium]
MKVTERHGVLLGMMLSLCWLAACGGPDIGVTNEEILIGTWAPVTGPSSAMNTIARGIDAYVQHVNEQGGIHERTIRLIVKDDGYDPSRTPEVVRQLVEEDRIFALVGGIGSASCLSVKDYLANEFIPWVNPGSALRQWVVPTNGYVFSILPSYLTEARILAHHAATELAAEKVGLFYRDDAFGREGQEGVTLGLGDVRKKLGVAESYALGSSDFAASAQKFKDAEIDTVILWSTPSEAAALIGEFEKLEYTPKLLATQVLADPVMFELVGEAWEGAVVATGVPDPDSDEPGVQRAREIMNRYAPDAPFGSYALMGLSWAEVLVEGLRQAGPELTRVRLIYALENLEPSADNFLGRPIQFSPESHHGFSAVRLMRAEGGKYVYISEWIDEE